MKTVVVSGASGQIGSKLSHLLLDSGYKVRALTRSKDNVKGLVDRGAEVLEGEMDDFEYLQKAFTGADIVFALIPPHYGAEDFRGYYNLVGDAIARALEVAKIEYVVNLSSVGAEHDKGTGPILGLHDQEKRLNALEGIKVLHLRPAYFMENVKFSLQPILESNILPSAINPEVKFPQVATADIAEQAFRVIDQQDEYKNQKVVEVLGPEDVSIQHVVDGLNTAHSQLDVKLVPATPDQARDAMVAAGLSASAASALAELNEAINGRLLNGQFGRVSQVSSEVKLSRFLEGLQLS